MMFGRRERRVRIDSRYEVSDAGVVYSDGLPLVARGGEVRLHGERKSVAYLVARAFLPNVEGREYVVHRNGDAEDDRAENLAWSERKEERRRGRRPQLRWIEAYTLDGELMGRWDSASAAALELGLEPRKVRDAARRKGKAGGLLWVWMG